MKKKIYPIFFLFSFLVVFSTQAQTDGMELDWDTPLEDLANYPVMYADNPEVSAITSQDYFPMLAWDTSPYKSYRYTTPNAIWDWINFRLLFPNGYDSLAQDGEQYPLIIMLHGAGESARMEWNNTNKTNTPYPEGDPRKDNNDHHLLFGGREHLEAVKSGRFPGFVLFPQNFNGTWINGKGEANSTMYQDLRKVMELVEYLISELKVDPNRIYIHGLSNGAAATWYAAYKRPDLFAAALPMSASGDPAMAEELKSVPLWVFQGALDTNPRPATTQLTISAVEEAGGSVRYTEYANNTHNTWNKAYAEQDFFEWMLDQQKNGSEVENQAPTVNAGIDKAITLPSNTASFTATTTDEDGSIASYLWEKISGPDANLSGVNTATLSVSALTEGSYTFKVTVTDNEGATAWDEVNLRVNAAPGQENSAPTVNAGADKTITLPTNTATLTGAASDEEGSIASYEWTKVSGPGVTMENRFSTTLHLSDLEEGFYVFRLSATDEDGASAADEVNITVKAAPVPDVSSNIDITAFPNPFNKFVNLKIKAEEAQKLYITTYNSQGTLVHEGSILLKVPGANKYTIDLSGKQHKASAYAIKVQNESGSYKKSFKVVKKK